MLDMVILAGPGAQEGTEREYGPLIGNADLCPQGSFPPIQL